MPRKRKNIAFKRLLAESTVCSDTSSSSSSEEEVERKPVKILKINKSVEKDYDSGSDLLPPPPPPQKTQPLSSKSSLLEFSELKRRLNEPLDGSSEDVDEPQKKRETLAETNELHNAGFSDHTDTDDTIDLQYFTSNHELKTAIANYEIKTITRYNVLNSTKNFDEDVSLEKYLKNQMKIKKKLPFVRWEMNQRNDKLPLKFTGTPYIWVGTKNYICHQGQDKNIRRKEKLKGQAAANFASKGDHPQYSKVRRNIRPTKKKHCSVSFAVKKLFLFPEYATDRRQQKERRGDVHVTIHI
ncbi:uncharacterized protein [Clytia hemisphaerica]